MKRTLQLKFDVIATKDNLILLKNLDKLIKEKDLIEIKYELEILKNNEVKILYKEL